MEIGGFLSARDANITMLDTESIIPSAQLVPLSMKLCCFGDNNFCFCPNDEAGNWLPYKKHHLGRIYNMKISMEQMECSVTFLALQLHIEGSNTEWGAMNPSSPPRHYTPDTTVS